MCACEQKKGKIINISSIAGRRGLDGISHYSASKAGVIVLSQVIAMQLASYNINVYVICPGLFWTPMTLIAGKIMGETYPQFKDMNAVEIFDESIRMKIPRGRPQTPEAIGQAVAFFASDEANEITGQTLNVDGGVVFN